MEPEWDKIKANPEKNYKVEGFYLLDQITRIGDLQKDLKQAEEKIKKLEIVINTQSQTWGASKQAQGQANEELKQQVEQLRIRIKKLINFFNEIAEIEPKIITKVKSKIDIDEVINIIKEYG